MTEYQKCLLVLALFAIVLSCNTKFVEQDSTRYSFNLLTKGACSVDSSFLVTEADIANYIKRIELARNRKCLGIQQVFHSQELLESLHLLIKQFVLFLLRTVLMHCLQRLSAV